MTIIYASYLSEGPCLIRLISCVRSRNFPRIGLLVDVGAVPFTSPEDLMKNLPKAMSNMFGGGAMSSESPTFKISMTEYEDMQLKVGHKVTIEIKRADSSGI
jgi:hypothetical protein